MLCWTPALNIGWMELQLINLGYTANFPLQSLIHSMCSALLFKGFTNQCKSRRCVPEGTIQQCHDLFEHRCLLLALLRISEVPAAPGLLCLAGRAFWAMGSECCCSGYQGGHTETAELLSSLPSKPLICPGDNKMKCWFDTESDLCLFEKGKLSFKSHSTQRCGT